MDDASTCRIVRSATQSLGRQGPGKGWATSWECRHRTPARAICACTWSSFRPAGGLRRTCSLGTCSVRSPALPTWTTPSRLSSIWLDEAGFEDIRPAQANVFDTVGEPGSSITEMAAHRTIGAKPPIRRAASGGFAARPADPQRRSVPSCQQQPLVVTARGSVLPEAASPQQPTPPAASPPNVALSASTV